MFYFLTVEEGNEWGQVGRRSEYGCTLEGQRGKTEEEAAKDACAFQMKSESKL